MWSSEFVRCVFDKTTWGCAHLAGARRTHDENSKLAHDDLGPSIY